MQNGRRFLDPRVAPLKFPELVAGAGNRRPGLLDLSRRVDYAEGFVASARETFEAAQSGYQSGLCTVSELSDAAGQLALAQSTRAGALAEYSTSLAAVAFASGMPAAGGEPARKPANAKK